MEERLIKVTPDKEKARSILKMVDTTLEMIPTIDMKRFSSHLTKEYYDVIRELCGVILLLDGYKTYGEAAHKRLFEYIRERYSELSEYDFSLIDELRVTRNKIAYDGFFVDSEYLERKGKDFFDIILKLKKITMRKF